MNAVIHNTIAQLREQADLTQQELAEAIGVTRQTIIALERGNYTPSLLLAFKISHFFKQRIEDIFTSDL